MADADFLVATTRNGDAVAVPVDVVTELGIDRSAEVTANAIEDGSDVADHTIRAPLQITASIFATQTPILFGEGWTLRKVPINPKEPPGMGGFMALEAAIGKGLKKLFGTKEKQLSVSVYQPASESDRVGDLDSLLAEILDNAYTCVMTWKGKVYPALQLTSCKRSDASTGEITFELEFRKVTRVSTQLAALPKPADLRAKPKKKVKEPAKKEEKKQSESYLFMGKEMLKQAAGIEGITG